LRIRTPDTITKSSIQRWIFNSAASAEFLVPAVEASCKGLGNFNVFFILSCILAAMPASPLRKGSSAVRWRWFFSLKAAFSFRLWRVQSAGT
jgi:hypothetical protein